jgi:hypothetical protein
MGTMARERWRVWTAGAAVVVAAAVVSVSLMRLWAYANTDNPAIIENPDVARVANAACAAMRDEAAAVAVATTAPIPQRVGAINAQNDAVTELVVTVGRFVRPEELQHDRPAAAWLEDWQRLVRVRDAYAQSLASGHPKPMAMPVLDGQTLQERLNDVGLNCRVPLVLLAP